MWLQSYPIQDETTSPNEIPFRDEMWIEKSILPQSIKSRT